MNPDRIVNKVFELTRMKGDNHKNRLETAVRELNSVWTELSDEMDKYLGDDPSSEMSSVRNIAEDIGLIRAARMIALAELEREGSVPPEVVFGGRCKSTAEGSVS